MAFLEERERPKPLRPEDFTTRASVRAEYDSTETATLNFINRLDETILQKEFIWRPPMTPEPQRVTGWQVLLHVVNHGTDHRAQILRILHDFGAPTFDQDLMGYLWQTGQTKLPE